MGLDAVVYKNKIHLPFDVEALGAAFDPATGEYYFEDIALDRKYPRELFEAAAKRLGNMDAIARIREEVVGVFGGNSIVISKVVYSGTHADDFLPVEILPALESELAALDEYLKMRTSPLVSEFVTDMRELISAAKHEGNPIVF
jgi:hypothetical protein